MTSVGDKSSYPRHPSIHTLQTIWLVVDTCRPFCLPIHGSAVDDFRTGVLSTPKRASQSRYTRHPRRAGPWTFPTEPPKKEKAAS